MKIPVAVEVELVIVSVRHCDSLVEKRAAFQVVLRHHFVVVVAVAVQTLIH